MNLFSRASLKINGFNISTWLSIPSKYCVPLSEKAIALRPIKNVCSLDLRSILRVVYVLKNTIVMAGTKNWKTASIIYANFAKLESFPDYFIFFAVIPKTFPQDILWD